MIMIMMIKITVIVEKMIIIQGAAEKPDGFQNKITH
jgi:hypothetical protein